jgi:hypothetical protein
VDMSPDDGYRFPAQYDDDKAYGPIQRRRCPPPIRDQHRTIPESDASRMMMSADRSDRRAARSREVAVDHDGGWSRDRSYVPPSPLFDSAGPPPPHQIAYQPLPAPAPRRHSVMIQASDSIYGGYRRAPYPALGYAGDDDEMFATRPPSPPRLEPPGAPLIGRLSTPTDLDVWDGFAGFPLDSHQSDWRQKRDERRYEADDRVVVRKTAYSRDKMDNQREYSTYGPPRSRRY